MTNSSTFLRWSRKLERESTPGILETALRYANQQNLQVSIGRVHDPSNYGLTWSVTPLDNPDFSLETFQTRKQAFVFCEETGWIVHESTFTSSDADVSGQPVGNSEKLNVTDTNKNYMDEAVKTGVCETCKEASVKEVGCQWCYRPSERYCPIHISAPIENTEVDLLEDKTELPLRPCFDNPNDIRSCDDIPPTDCRHKHKINGYVQLDVWVNCDSGSRSPKFIRQIDEAVKTGICETCKEASVKEADKYRDRLAAIALWQKNVGHFENCPSMQGQPCNCSMHTELSELLDIDKPIDSLMRQFANETLLAECDILRTYIKNMESRSKRSVTISSINK